MTARAPSRAPLVEMAGVSRAFAGLTVLQPTDLRIDQGDLVAIMGPSGSGKSTLLHLVGLLDRPSAGMYRFEGRDVAGLGDGERALLRSRRIGFVFQAFHLLGSRTAVENVELGMLYQGVSRAERRDRAVAALERVGLAHRIRSFPTTLSGGEQQRVAVARAVAAGAGLVLADEPTGNLDTAAGALVLDLFDELHAGGLTLVVITHNPDVAARASRQFVMRDGVLAAAGDRVAAAR